MTTASKPAGFYANFGGLATLKGAAKNQDPKALREAARQFESLFTQMMLKSMRQASLGDSMMDNDQSNMYREMYDNQMAAQLSKGRGLGLSDMLVRQLTQGSAGSDKPSAENKASTAGISLNANKNRTPSLKDFGNKFPAIKLDTVQRESRFPVPQARISVLPIAPMAIASPPIAAQRGIEAGRKDAGVESFAPIALPYLQATPQLDLQPLIVVPIASQTDSPDAPITSLSTAQVKDPRSSQPRPQPLAKDAADFVRQLWPYAQKAARELGVDAKTLIAHAALETGWGKFVPCNPDGSCSYNLFGIKATGRWTGSSTAVNSLEYQDGIAVKRRESFRTYDSPADSFRDYAQLIKNSPRYASAVGAGDAATFASALQQGGYATDPNYAAKLTATAARLSSMDTASPLKIAANQPLLTGRRVSTGDNT